MIELPLILGWAWWVRGRILRRLRPMRGEAVVMGAFAFALLMLGGTGISVRLAGRSLLQHLALYGQAQQALGLLGQLCFACFPWLQSRRERTHPA